MLDDRNVLPPYTQQIEELHQEITAIEEGL